MTSIEVTVARLWEAFEKDYSAWPALCDALEEAGQGRVAAAVREGCRRGNRPEWDGVTKSWDWWNVEVFCEVFCSDVGEEDKLADEVFFKLKTDRRGRRGDVRTSYREYDSWREAWEALAGTT